LPTSADEMRRNSSDGWSAEGGAILTSGERSLFARPVLTNFLGEIACQHGSRHELVRHASSRPFSTILENNEVNLTELLLCGRIYLVNGCNTTLESVF
jgi:hypothetical protein